MVPAQSALRPSRITLDEVTQRVTGVARLTDGLDLVVRGRVAAAARSAVVPDLTALDLEADDAGTLDGDDEVDLVVLEVVGDALAGDDPVVGLQLVDAAPGRPCARRALARRGVSAGVMVTGRPAPDPRPNGQAAR